MLKEQIDPNSCPDPTLYAYHLKRYQFARQFVKGMTVLDSGCGEGYGSILLSADASCVYGIDKDKIVIEQAERRYPDAKVHFLSMDVMQTDFPTAMFDVVVSFEIVEHLRDHHAYYAEVVRLLKPSGVFICSTPNRLVEELHMKSIGMDYPYHVSLVDGRAFRGELRCHFHAVQLFGMRRRGNGVYSVLRSLDYFNLRLRLFPYTMRRTVQEALGVGGPALTAPDKEAIIIAPRHLRQSNTLLAVCVKPFEAAGKFPTHSKKSGHTRQASDYRESDDGPHPTTVLFIHCQSQIGGAETLLLSTLKYLDRTRYRPIVICFGTDEDPLPTHLRNANIDYQLIPPHRLRQLDLTVQTFQHLVRVVQENDAAIIIGYSLYPFLYGSLLAVLTGKKGLCYVMDLVRPKWWGNGLLKTLPMVIGKGMVLSDSNHVGENLQKAFPWVRSVATVYHGIDQARFDPALYDTSQARRELGVPQESPVVAIVGRLQTWKGQHIFIQAADLVSQKHPDAKFLIVGGTINQIEPAYADRLRRQVEELGLQGRVIFVGHRDDVPAIMAVSDLIVHASIEPEPFGCVIIEGMAMKKPVIATNIGGPPEIIANGETGLLIPPNDPPAMAEAIQILLRDRALRVRMGEQGRKRVEAYFTAERMTRQIEAAIEACLLS